MRDWGKCERSMTRPSIEIDSMEVMCSLICVVRDLTASSRIFTDNGARSKVRKPVRAGERSE
jgi:hypothetical protein